MKLLRRKKPSWKKRALKMNEDLENMDDDFEDTDDPADFKEEFEMWSL